MLGYTVILPARPGSEAETAAASAAIAAACQPARANLVVPDAPLDLGSFASTRAFCEELLAAGAVPRIDALCLNAGRGGGPEDPRDATVDGHEAIVQTNAASHFLMVSLLMPLLRASDAARIVWQSSGGRFHACEGHVRPKISDLDGGSADHTFNAFHQYALSKAAMCLLMKGLNERLLAFGVHNVISCASDPGLSATGVNLQHDFFKTEFIPQAVKDSGATTQQMHSAQGHHAADGALPMVLAVASPAAHRNAWFTTDGVGAGSVEEAAHIADPATSAGQGGVGLGQDPLLEDAWPRDVRESVWEQMVAWSGAQVEEGLSAVAKV